MTLRQWTEHEMYYNAVTGKGLGTEPTLFFLYYLGVLIDLLKLMFRGLGKK